MVFRYNSLYLSKSNLKPSSSIIKFCNVDAICPCSTKDLFTIYMSIAANATSTFTVDYEELIYREQSLYRKTITINPGGIVDDLSASIRVKEPEGFSSYSTSDFATIDVVSSEEIVCQYSASIDTQRAAGSDGVSLIMSCEYDFVHPVDGAGNFAVNGEYFAQFFSPLVTNILIGVGY